MRSVIITIAALTLAAIGAIAFWAGIFDRVDFQQQAVGTLYRLYRPHQGSPRLMGLVMRDVYGYARSRSMTPQQGFAVYLDDPAQRPVDSLRSIGGILTDSLLSAVDSPYVVDSLPPCPMALVGHYPLRSFFSYMSGAAKAYPALQALLQARQLELTRPVMEVYDLQARQIRYIACVQPLLQRSDSLSSATLVSPTLAEVISYE